MKQDKETEAIVQAECRSVHEEYEFFVLRKQVDLRFIDVLAQYPSRDFIKCWID